MHRILLFLIFLYAMSAGAQQNFLAEMSARFHQYQQHHFQEKVYLHTDKNFYVTGDILWFRAYTTDAAGNQPLFLSKVVYTELLDAAHKPVLQATISMEDGGSGSFQLPLSLQTGVYTLRSYTSWMKNFSPEFFFTKAISVVNPLQSAGSEMPLISNNLHVEHFPEGGQMVNGLPSKLVFKLTDAGGKGIDAEGLLLDEKNDTVTHFRSFAFGIGSFTFTPMEGKSYRTVFTLSNGRSVTKELPVALSTGFVMQLQEQGQGELLIHVRSNTATDGAEIFLVGHNRKQSQVAEKTNMVNGQAVFRVSRGNLGAGINTFTVFANRKPVAERLYFIQPPVSSFTARLDQKEYFSRKKASVVFAEPSPELLDPQTVSLSVYKIDTLQQRDQMDIVNYLWLTSELNGNVEHPAFYFSSHAMAKEAADNLMLSHGWRRFKWNDVMELNKSTFTYPYETTGPMLMASVLDASGKKVTREIPVFLSIPTTRHKLFAAKTNPSGVAQFQVKDFYGQGEVFVQTAAQDSMYSVELLSSFSDKYTVVNHKAIQNFSVDPALLVQYSVGMQASNIYNGASLARFRSVTPVDSFPFYGKAMYSYNLDDYKRFTTMEEVFREFVREINVGARSSGLRFRLFNEVKREMGEENNLVTIDGVILQNPHRIFSFDPLLFKKIDIITRNYVLGSSLYNGVAAFYTYKGNFEGLEADAKAVVVNYEGLQQQRAFYAPVYETEQQLLSRIPDFRKTVYWQPSVGTKSVEFYTPDTKGRFMISIQGFDKKGAPVSWNEFFEVK